MDVKVKLIVFAVGLLVPLAVGYACRYQQVVKEQIFNKMILNNILVVSFLSFWVMPLTSELLWLPLLGLLMGVVPGAMAYYVAKHKYDNELDRGSYVMAACLSNLGTIGGLCVFLLYGEKGYGHQQIILLFQYVLMFMFCYPLAQVFYQRAHGGGKAGGISVRSVLLSKSQIAVLGILLGGVLQVAGVERPAQFDGVAQVLIHLGHGRV